MSVRIFFDTNAFPRNPWAPGQEYEVLKELVDLEQVIVFASEVSIEEWKGQMERDFIKPAQDGAKAMETILRQGWADQSGARMLLPSRENVDQFVNTVKQIIHDRTSALLEFIRCRTVQIAADDGRNVMTSYFAGAPPFGEKRMRADIPDSFIYEAAKRISTERECVAICRDKRLTDALIQLDRVAVFETVQKFLESPKGRNAQLALDRTRIWIPEFRAKLLAFIRQQERALAERIHPYLVRELIGEEFEDDDIPSTDNSAVLTEIGPLSDLQISWLHSRELGPGWITVPFTCESDGEIKFKVYGADAFAPPDWMSVDLGDDRYHSSYDATGAIGCEIRGELVLRYTLPELTTPDWDLPRSITLRHVEFVPVIPDE